MVALHRRHPFYLRYPMAALRLPLWFATERRRLGPSVDHARDDVRKVLAFTRSEPLSTLLFSGDSGQWKIELVAEQKELLAMVADLHDRGVQTICLDSDGKGNGG